MTELITITTGEQGSPVVKSARELHGFLEVKSRFNDWFKNRVTKYGFVEGRDYVTVSKDLESEGFTKNLEKPGRPEIDYALTLGTAKELAMVERTERGREARQYFIEAEERLQRIAATSPAVSTTEQVLLQLVSQTNQLMASQQEMLAQLRADVDGIMQGKKALSPFSRPWHGKQLPIPGIPAAPVAGPGLSLRVLINRRIDEYCQSYGYDRRETWNYLHRRLFEVYAVDVYRLNRAEGESLLDAIERYGRLNDLYRLVMNELPLSDDHH